ncbi:MAG: histidine kinase [Frankiales bacterium]|nr:histidine kinase [Frankiales bacterium]
MLVEVVESLLTSVLEASSLLLLQVSSPLLVHGPVVVERGSSGPGTGEMTVVSKPIPASVHVPAGTVVIAGANDQAVTESRLLPLLLSCVMDAEVRRQVAESAMRGALEIANRDPATGLGNRRAWLQALRVESSRAHRTGRPLSVLVLDLDGLKAVNDAHGHAAGDELIVRTAQVLASARRATDEVCRLGGDEFGIVAPDTDSEQAAALAQRVRDTFARQHVKVSLGWAVSGRESTVDQLWQKADAAMYDDKRSRR